VITSESYTTAHAARRRKASGARTTAADASRARYVDQGLR
jgi:hypothetical protein